MAWRFHEDSGELTIFPKDDIEQNKINNDLLPGCYAIEISMSGMLGQSKKASKLLGRWTISISNSHNADPAPSTQLSPKDGKEGDGVLNLFSSSELVIEAGKPFTFNVEISGSTAPRDSSCSLADVADNHSNNSCSVEVLSRKQCKPANNKVLRVLKTE